MSKISAQDPEQSPPERAAGYVRVSTRKQAAEGLSLGEQERRLRAYVEAEGWDLCEVYADAESGRTVDRPGLTRMLEAAEAGAFDVLVIPKIDRFGRNFRESVELKGRLEDAGVRLLAMDLRMDFSTGTGPLIWSTMTAVAQLESENIGQRVAYVAEARARSGKLPGGRRKLYGYVRAGGDVVIDQAEALLVRRVFEQAAAGMAIREITYRLNDDHLLTSEGCEWSRQNVRRLLMHPEYRGAVAYKGAVVCEQGEQEPIVSRELWNEAQQALNARKALPARGGGRRPKGRHLLAGLLKCGICGQTLRVRTYEGGRGSYACERGKDHRRRCQGHGPYPQDVIDGRVLDYFNRVGLDMEATREAFASTAQRRIAEARSVREAAEREEAEANDRLARMRRYFQNGTMVEEDWDGHREELEPELAAASAELERARKAEMAAIEGADLHDAEEMLLRYLDQLRKRIVGDVRDAEGAEAVRGALVKLFDHFTLYDEEAMAVASSSPNPAHGWQSDLFFESKDGANCYLLPQAKPVAVEGFDVPTGDQGYAPAEAFPVLKRTAISPPNEGPSVLTQSG